ncbi:ABC transporter substrate-binding protein [Rathayibacter tritici]|uniref:ABC transporter substrate-binding protein n=1 Tax=Rathayibacter tritici TaxID=33888 RepID=UPI000CE8F193|nr:ABC transporter substrate-binding protein [Rathayibacter tritici]PPF31749.1 ABC transporter substrate-binding protein [Rathayibacter tritici]PPI13048.1 ABC transporter substrate-binding protein [Rathayibacter tritici]
MLGHRIHPQKPRLTAAVALALVSTVVLAGCSTATGGDSADGTTTITLSMQNPDVETADPATWAIVQAFEAANPDITVDVTGQAVAEHLQSLTIAAQSDTLPDVFWVYKATAEDMLDAGRLLDLAPVLDELNVTDRFPESTVTNFTKDDVMYGVPYQGLLTGLWYNEKILSDNGLAVPTTFDDLVEVADTLSKKGIVTISNGANQSSFSVWSFLVWLDRFGYQDKIDGILDGSDSYSNPDFLRMYEHIAELRDAGAFASNVSTQTYQQAVDQFLQGKAAMLDAGVWASSSIQDSAVAADTGFWAGPQFSDGVGEQNIIMNVASAPLVVDHKVGDDENKLAAVEKFLAFYYSDQAQQLLVDNGQPPVTDYAPQLDATKQSALKSALDATTADGVSSPQTQPDLLVSTAVSSAMYDSIYGVIQDQLSPQQAVDLVQKAIDAGQ